MSHRIPYEELRIADDWKVIDLLTVEDCEAATIQLTRDIANIDAQITDEEAAAAVSGVAIDNEWLSSAKSARAVKTALKSIVQRRQGEITRTARAAARETQDRKLIGILKVKAPDAFAAAVVELGDA